MFTHVVRRADKGLLLAIAQLVVELLGDHATESGELGLTIKGMLFGLFLV